MRAILTIKHWQLFTLIIIPALLFSGTSLGEIVSVICGLLFLLWIYSIGYFGQKQIRSLGLRPMNLKLFQANVLLLPILMFLSRMPLFSGEQSNKLDLVEVILGLYSAFASFHVLLFAGKTFAELEYRRQVSFDEYFMNSLQIIVFILGIWTLQPRLNKQFGVFK